MSEADLQPVVHLLFSVHDLDSSACDTETEEKKTNLRVSGLNKQKFIRSKSSSPNRQVRAWYFLFLNKFTVLLLIMQPNLD